MSQNNFWKNPSPAAFALAPMEDVTDTVFRELVMSTAAPGKLHLLFTEFTSVDGICHPSGRNAVLHRFLVNRSEATLLKKNNVKLIAQIWGNDPEKFFKAAEFIAREFLFDGIDINMGCPVGKVVKQNTCSALIDHPELALEIIEATIKGSGMPVSVKTRTGTHSHQTERWIGQLLGSDLSAITLHARTQKMLSIYPADWEQVSLAVKVMKGMKADVKILGNGDVNSYDAGLKLIESSGADGVMIGRGIFANPWFFSEDDSQRNVKEKVALLEKHVRLFQETWNNSRNFSILKRFFKIYIHGFEGAAKLRALLMDTRFSEEALDIINQFRKGGFEHNIQENVSETV
ncbi:MAG: dihydrouridine synthase du [Bacteroidetes bacterium]|nr:MAG: dihydrouridine synthase du [Bacteroidota bacterium]